MEALRAIFTGTIELPFLIAGLIARFFLFLFRPYAGTLTTIRLLQSSHLPSVILIGIVFLCLVLSLGFQNTRDLILSFQGGMTDSLQHLAKINTNGKEFLYLLLFVLGATVFVLLLGLVLRDVLIRKGTSIAIMKINKNGVFSLGRNSRKIFLDMYNVFISFIIGWFLVLAISISYFAELSINFKNLFESVGFFQGNRVLGGIFMYFHLPDVNDALFNPAIVIVLFISFYFGILLVSRLQLRSNSDRSLIKTKIINIASLSFISVLPPAVAFVCIVIPIIYLAELSSSLFSLSQTGNFTYDSACVQINESKQVFANISVKSNLATTQRIGAIYLSFWNKVKFEGMPFDSVRIEPADFVWSSKKGLFLEPSETRYFRFVLSDNRRSRWADLRSCRVQNSAEGEYPNKEDTKNLTYRTRPDIKVESAEAVSKEQTTE